MNVKGYDILAKKFKIKRENAVGCCHPDPHNREKRQTAFSNNLNTNSMNKIEITVDEKPDVRVT